MDLWTVFGYDHNGGVSFSFLFFIPHPHPQSKYMRLLNVCPFFPSPRLVLVLSHFTYSLALPSGIFI